MMYCISSALVSVIAAAHAIGPPGGGYVALLAKDFVFHWMEVELAVPADAKHGAWFDLTRYWPSVTMMNVKCRPCISTKHGLCSFPGMPNHAICCAVGIIWYWSFAYDLGCVLLPPFVQERDEMDPLHSAPSTTSRNTEIEGN